MDNKCLYHKPAFLGPFYFVYYMCCIDAVTIKGYDVLKMYYWRPNM